MNKKILNIISAILAISMCFSCKKADEPVVTADSSVLVYMVASNNLGSAGNDDADLREMLDGAASISQLNTNWLVYHTRADGSEATLCRLRPKTATWDTLAVYPSGVSATKERLSGVINDFKRYAPANHYGLVLWSHATGWLQDGIPAPAQATKKRSFGSDFGQRMNVTSLAEALNGKNIEFVYFDACYMATVEVAYELRNVTDYLVASPSEIPADGMPYDQNMAPLCRMSEDGLIKAADNTFNHYNSKSVAVDRTCTISVIKTSELDNLAKKTAEIYIQSPLKHPLANPTNYRGTTSQGYSLDFGEYVDALADVSHLSQEKSDFDNALKQCVVFHRATAKLWDAWPMTNPTGLATYVFNRPSDLNIKGYDQLQWARDVVIPTRSIIYDVQ